MGVAPGLLAALALRVPLALGGEAEGANSIGLGVISLVSIVLGWVVLAGLWWFVFRDKSQSKRKKRSPD
jgi:hypothetical protein